MLACLQARQRPRALLVHAVISPTQANPAAPPALQVQCHLLLVQRCMRTAKPVRLDSLRHQKARVRVSAARRVNFSHSQVNLCVSTAMRVNFPQDLQLHALGATQASTVVQLPRRALHALGGRPVSKAPTRAPRVWLAPGATLAQMVNATSARQEPILQPAPSHVVDVTVGPTLSKGLSSVLLAQPASTSHRLHTCPAM